MRCISMPRRPAMKRRAIALLPKREVLRRTKLAPPTLTALIRAGAFPPPILNGRWEPAAVDGWMADNNAKLTAP